MKVGQFVEWDSSGGTARGKITQIVENGEVSGISVKITGTPEEPAARIQLYKENSEGEYEPTDTYVGHKLTELRGIKSLSEDEMEEEELTPRQMALTNAYIAIADTYGKFGWGTDSEGAHYTPASENPFISKGLVCKNCALYAEDSYSCSIVSGIIEEEAICKFWVIENYELGINSDESPSEPMEAEAARYADIDFSPPDAVRAAAKSGLALHEKGLSGNGLEPATVLWARKYAEGQPVSPERARMGNRFYGRNARFANAPKDSPAWVSWQLWGGSAGKSWFASLVRQMDNSEKKSKAQTQTKASVHGFMRMAESNMTNPLLKEVELVLTDFEANANKEGIPQKEAANIIRTALHTPIKIAVSETGYAGHKGAIPVGPIIEVYEDTYEGKPVVKAKAVIWSDEFKEVYSLLKSQAGEREYIGTSWEVYYESADSVDGVSWLNNVTFAGTCIVDVPAYGERTKLLKVAEKEMVEELQTKIKELEENLQAKENELDGLRKENDAYKAEANAKAQAEKRQEVASKLLSAGFTQSEVEEKLDFYLELPETAFEKILADFVKTRTEASKKTDEPVSIPNVTGTSTQFDSKAIADGLKQLLKKK